MRLTPLFRKVLGSALFSVLALLLAPASSWASFITYTTSGPSGDGPLAAQADFTTSAGQIVVKLTNTLAASLFGSPGQGLSDISFTLSNAPGILGSDSASGQFGDIDKHGKVTYVTKDTQTGLTSPTRWFANGSLSSNPITLEAIGAGQPSEMIAPNIANGATFTSANQGVKNFDSWVIGPATFTLNFAGITANTKVTSVTFSFGTSPDASLPGVPEPATIALALSGLGSFGIAGLRRIRREPADATA